MADASRPAYIFRYFPAFGRGEPIRHALSYFEIPYAEILFSLEQWSGGEKESGLYEFKQMPMLELGGKRYVQSMAILRYICRKNNAYPTDINEAALVESIVELRYEIYDQVAIMNYTGKPVEVKAWYRDNLGRYLTIFENLLAAGRGMFFVGNKVSMADFVMYEFCYSALTRPKNRDVGDEFRSKAPKLFAFIENFKKSKPAFTAFMNNRDQETVNYPF